jgi:hypothetical protein
LLSSLIVPLRAVGVRGWSMYMMRPEVVGMSYVSLWCRALQSSHMMIPFMMFSFPRTLRRPSQTSQLSRPMIHRHI